MSGSRATIFLGLPMSINVRDVLRTDVYRVLREHAVDIHLFTAAAHVPEFHEEFGGEGVWIHPLVRPTGRLFRVVDGAVLKLYVLVLSLRCETARIMLAGTLRRNPLSRLARGALRVLGRRGPGALVRLGRALTLRVAPDLYAGEFERYRPDLVIGTRVLTMTGHGAPESDSYLDRYLVMSAARRGVPCMVLVSSWDNLTTKGFLPAEVYRLTVWNEIMRREAVELHDVPPERVVVTGAPQHDVYAAAPFEERDRFLARLGLDPRGRVVVYTTQTEGTIPEEPRLVRLIHGLLREHFGPSVQLLVRVHQLDRVERYRALEGLPGLVFDQAGRQPLGHYRDRDFDAAALRDLADTLCHGDVVLNCASSISIDAAAVDSPVVAVAFDPDPDVPYERSVRRYYDYTHQRNVVRSGGVFMARSAAELVEGVRRYLEDPRRDAEGRARLVAEQCYRLDGRSGERVAQAILEALAEVRGEAVAPVGPAAPAAVAPAAAVRRA